MSPFSYKKKIFYKINNDLYLYDKKYKEIKYIERTYYEIYLKNDKMVIFTYKNHFIIFYNRKYIYGVINRNSPPVVSYKKYREVLNYFTIERTDEKSTIHIEDIFIYCNFIIINNSNIINIENLSVLDNIEAQISKVLDLDCLKITYKNISKLFYERSEIPIRKIRKPFIQDILKESDDHVKLLYLMKEQFELKAVALLFLQRPEFIYKYSEAMKLFIKRSNGDCKKIFLGLNRLGELVCENREYNLENKKEKIFYLNKITKEFIKPYIENKFLMKKKFFSRKNAEKFDQYRERFDALYRELKKILLDNFINPNIEDEELFLKKKLFNNNRELSYIGEGLYYFCTGLTVNQNYLINEKNHSDNFIVQNYEFLRAIAEPINRSVNLSDINQMAIMAYGIKGALKQFDVVFSTYLFNKNNLYKNFNLIAFALSYKNSKNSELISIADTFLRSKKLIDKQAGIFSLGILNSIEHENRLIAELNRKDIYRNNSYNDFFIADIHYLISAISISLISTKTVVESKNTFYNLLVNGIRFFNSNNENVKFIMKKSDRIEGRFYYSLLSNTIDFQLTEEDVLILLSRYLRDDEGEEYEMGGLAFYIGLKVLRDNTARKFYKKIHQLTLLAEKKSSLIFEYLLLSLVLISSHNMDLNIEVIRIIRRKIMEAERAVKFESRTYFIIDEVSRDETVHTISYGKIEKYKMMAGLLLMNGGKMRLNFSSRYFMSALIASFYICDSITYKEQINYQYIKYLIYLPIEAKVNVEILNKKTFNVKNVCEKDLFTYNDIRFSSVKTFENKIHRICTMELENKKILLDLLSEYYEKCNRKYNSIVLKEYIKLPF